MKKFIMFGHYCSNVTEKREPFREEHLEHLRKMKRAGLLEKAGPTKDLKQIFAIFMSEDEQSLRAEIEKDPYWLNQIWTDYELKEWIDAI